METNIRNTYETKITNMKTEYDQHITSIINRGDPEADAKINNLVQELERLNGLLSRYQRENEDLKRKIRELESFIDRQEKEATETINQQNQNIRNLEAINADLQRQLFDLQERLKRSGESEQQLITIRRDYDKIYTDYNNQEALIRQLQSRIYELENQLNSKDRQVSEHTIRVQTLHDENELIKRNSENAGKSIDALRRENDELKRRLNSLADLER